MDFRGIVDHGVVRPTEPVELPEGSEVECRLVQRTALQPTQDWSNRSIADLLAEQGLQGASNLDKIRGEWPPDEDVDEFIASAKKGRR